MSHDRSTRLLIVHETQNDAEELVNLLRNSGQATQMTFIASAGEFEHQLGQTQWDLILIKENVECINVVNALRLATQLAPQTPTLVILDEFSEEKSKEFLDQNAFDLALENDEVLLLNRMSSLISAYQWQIKVADLQQQLDESESRCQALLQSSKDAIAYVHGGMHIFANQSYIDLFECEDEDEVFCMPIMDLIDSSVHSQLKEALKDDGWLGEIESNAVTVSDKKIPVSLSFSRASYEGEVCTQIVVREQQVAVNEEAIEQRLKEISQTDSTTGLLNNEAFDELFKTELENTNKEHAYYYLHINNAMEIRTQTGVQQYPMVLKQLAESLSFILSNSQVCRLSDDSFVFFNDKSKQDAQVLAHDVVDHCHTLMFEINGKTVQIKVACGISLAQKDIEISQILSEAQKASETAAENSDRVAMFNRADISHVDSTDNTAMIEHALSHDGFKILFQPIISIRGDSEENYEVFVRLKGTDGEMIAAGEFISAAEGMGKSIQIDRWVVEQVFVELAEHHQKDARTTVFIHISPSTIANAEFLPWLRDKMKEYKVPAGSLAFQVSQNDAKAYLKAAVAFSKGLDSLKCKLLINNFQCDDTSAGLLKYLNIGYIKLNDALINKLSEDDGYAEELQKTLAPYHQKGILSIVPKIENAGMIAALWQIGVAYIQGYYVKEPADSMDYDFDMEE
jgi:multidomain signaling protein FimX